MKKLILSLIIISLIIIPVSAESNVNVKWNLAGCWISLNTPAEYLIAPIGGTTYNVWEPGQIIGGDSLDPHEIEVKTSCKGYNLNVKATSFNLPDQHKSNWYSENTIEDFQLKGEVITSGTSSSTPDWFNFVGYNNDKEILSIGNPRTTITNMYYRYHLDENDVEGQYVVTLVYTVSH